MKSEDRLGDWILVRELGRGMSAATWLACPAAASLADIAAAPTEAAAPAPEQVEGNSEAAPGRVAVLKILDLSDMGSWNVADLFRREAEALRHLDHPGIPAWIDSFESPENGHLRLVLAMEFMEGTNLEAAVKSGRRFMEAEIASILAGLADILSYLGSIRPPVVHRDVNPRNVILRPDGSVALVDFSGAQDAVRAALFPGATLVGTAGYTPVEQVAGKASPRSDLYGAATTAVFLLTGRNPAELPAKGMKIDLDGIMDISPELSFVLDSWLEADPSLRELPASDAAAILRGQKPLPVPAPAPVLRTVGPASLSSGDRAAVKAAEVYTSLPASVQTLIERISRQIPAEAGGADFRAAANEWVESNEPVTLPSDSKVSIAADPESLKIRIPPIRRGTGVSGMIFATFWLGFVAFWTSMSVVMGAPIIFPIFSIPFWLVGFFMVKTFIKSVFGTTTLSLGRAGLTIEESLFGVPRVKTWPLSDLGNCTIGVSGVRMQDQQSEQLVLEAGTARLTIGMGLTHRELVCVSQAINNSKRELSL